MTTDTPELERPGSGTGRRAPPTEQAALPAPETVRFWQRPYVERYLVPFVLPVLVVGGVVMFILNISRIFLSTHGNVDVIVGTVITLVDPHRRVVARRRHRRCAPRRSTLITGGFVVAILMFGWLALGTAEPEGEAGSTLPAEGPAELRARRSRRATR